MTTQRTTNLTAIINAIVISIACVAISSFAYGQELILVHLASQTGDIEKVEHQLKDGKKIEMRRDSSHPFQGLIRLDPFQYSVVKILDPKPGYPAICCPWGGGWLFCHQVETVIAAIHYDQKRNEFKVSLNSRSQDNLKELEKTDFDPSNRVIQPLTRNYHLASVKSESPSGFELWVIDESKAEVWR
jgi:hypothetical protein